MNFNKRNIYFFVLFLFVLIYACKKDNKESEASFVELEKLKDLSINCPEFILNNKHNNLNISILLDLSDRIEKDKIKGKDSAYLSILSKSFIDHVKKKKMILLEDRIQLFFNPAPSSSDINSIAQKLKIVFNKASSKLHIEKALSNYASYPSKLYDLAMIDAKSSGNFPGSDIWRFFQDNVKDYSIDKCHRNILVILTDGYMYHEETIMTDKNRTSYLTPKSLEKLHLNHNSWTKQMEEENLGFIPATTGLQDLEILVLGIDSQNKKHPYAKNIIKAYWSKWFTEMGIKKYKIKNVDVPTSIEKVISDFLIKD